MTVYAVILHKKWFCAKGSDGMNRIHVPKQKNRREYETFSVK